MSATEFPRRRRALAALILGNWLPVRVLVAALLFGFAQAVPLRLSDAPVISLLPDEFIRMFPYVVTIVAIAGFVGRVQPPAAAGRATRARAMYERGRLGDQ